MWGLPGWNVSLWEKIDVLLHQGPTFLFSLSVSLSLSVFVCVTVCVSLSPPTPDTHTFLTARYNVIKLPSGLHLVLCFLVYWDVSKKQLYTRGTIPSPPWWTVTSKWAKIKPSHLKLFRWIFVTSIKEKQLMQLIWRIHPLMANFLSYIPLSRHLTAQHEATGFISTSNQKEPE